MSYIKNFRNLSKFKIKHGEIWKNWEIVQSAYCTPHKKFPIVRGEETRFERKHNRIQSISQDNMMGKELLISDLSFN